MSHLSNHLTGADLDRVRRGAASAEEAAAVGRHVRECAECQALADEQLAIADSAAAFEAVFSTPLSMEATEGEVRSMPRRRVVLWAGAAAAAAVIAFLFVIPRPGQPRPASMPIVRVAPPAVVPPTTVVPRSEARPPEWDALLTQTRATGRLPFPADIRELATPDMFRGEPGAAVVSAMWPVATAIDEGRPEFRWPAVDGARSVVVLTSGGKELARSGSLTTSHWRVPSALRRGQMVRWQVRVERGETTSILPAPPAPPAIFLVISDEQHQEIARAKAVAPDDHLLIGLLYARAGVVEEARRELGASRDPLGSRLLKQLPRIR